MLSKPTEDVGCKEPEDLDCRELAELGMALLVVDKLASVDKLGVLYRPRTLVLAIRKPVLVGGISTFAGFCSPQRLLELPLLVVKMRPDCSSYNPFDWLVVYIQQQASAQLSELHFGQKPSKLTKTATFECQQPFEEDLLCYRPLFVADKLAWPFDS